MSFRSQAITTDPHTNLTTVEDFSSERLWTIVSSICQSNVGVEGAELLTIDLTILNSLAGGA